MAYSCVRVQFEIGHEASIRNKRTQNGFTHDWEVFVRGADNAEIHHFVDKVVFHLHETFPKPKRIVKEPPYSVKESGYAGFNLPIDIYLKNKDEGNRKVRFYYDLTLQEIGVGSARFSNIVREKADFSNPAEDLRRKLIKGGGVGVGSDGNTAAFEKPSSNSGTNNVSNNHNSGSSNHIDETKHSPAGKGKGEPPSKKHKVAKEVKPEEFRLNNSFAELFGTPIKTTKHSPNPKPGKSSSEGKSNDKSAKESSKIPKHSPAKEKDKGDRDKEKREKESEKNTSKEKSSKDKESHKNESEKPKEKPRKFSQKDFLKKDEDRKKPAEEAVMVKEKEKSVSKTDGSVKSEKKHEDKKNRDDKEKKEKHKRDSHEKKEAKEVEKEKPVDKKHDVVKEPVKEVKEISASKHKVEKDEKKSKSSEKSKEKSSSEPEKPKHKHKKKDKHRKDEEREKVKKKDKDKDKELVNSGNVVHEVVKPSKSLAAMPPTLQPMKEKSPRNATPPPPPPTLQPTKGTGHPLNALFAELADDKDSDSDFSGSEDVIKTEPVEREPSPLPAPPPPPPPPPPKIKEEKKPEIKEEKPEKPKKKEKKSKDDEYRKRKRKHKDKDSSREEPQEKTTKILETHIKEERISPEPMSPYHKSRSPSPENTLFTEEYINQLKDLQHKIMTLQDNADLQKVVQVISETGQFEITQRTFDFDLCALDRSTVKMLQDMFISA